MSRTHDDAPLDPRNTDLSGITKEELRKPATPGMSSRGNPGRKARLRRKHWKSPARTELIRIAQLNGERNKSTVINLLNNFTDKFDIILVQEPPWFRIGESEGREVWGVN